MTNRIVVASLAAVTIFGVASLSTGSPAAMRGCWTNKQCPRGAHCQPGLNPKVRGICVVNPPSWPCNREKDCRPGFHCTGTLIPKKAGLCVRNH
jgi:hypothetical protein